MEDDKSLIFILYTKSREKILDSEISYNPPYDRYDERGEIGLFVLLPEKSMFKNVYPYDDSRKILGIIRDTMGYETPIEYLRWKKNAGYRAMSSLIMMELHTVRAVVDYITNCHESGCSLRFPKYKFGPDAYGELVRALTEFSIELSSDLPDIIGLH